MKIRKDFNVKIVSLIISISFLFTTTLYAYPESGHRDSLRLHIGEDDTTERMNRLMHDLKIDLPLERASEEPDKPRLRPIKQSEFEERPMFARMLNLFERVGLDNLTEALKVLCEADQIQRFTPKDDKEWVVRNKAGKVLYWIVGHASDSYITLSARLEPGSAEETRVLGEELLKYFNVRDAEGQHLNPAFGEALLEALRNNDHEPIMPFKEHLENLDITARRKVELLKEADKVEGERHYTARQKRGRKQQKKKTDPQALYEEATATLDKARQKAEEEISRLPSDSDAERLNIAVATILRKYSIVSLETQQKMAARKLGKSGNGVGGWEQMPGRLRAEQRAEDKAGVTVPRDDSSIITRDTPTLWTRLTRHDIDLVRRSQTRQEYIVRGEKGSPGLQLIHRSKRAFKIWRDTDTTLEFIDRYFFGYKGGGWLIKFRR